jgi:hypothetical protein
MSHANEPVIRSGGRVTDDIGKSIENIVAESVAARQHALKARRRESRATKVDRRG